MAADAGIYNAFAIKPKSVADFDAERADAEGNLLGLKLKRAQVGEYETKAKNSAAVQSALQRAGPNAPYEARISALESTGLAEGYDAADRLRKSISEAENKKSETDKNNAATKKSDFETVSSRAAYQAQRLVTVMDYAGAERWYDDAVKLGQISPEQAAADKARVPKNPAEFADWKTREMLAGMTVHQQAVTAETQRHQQTTEKETNRHNVAGEKVAQGHLGVSQGQLGVSRGNLSVAQQRLEFDKSQPKGVLAQTDQGPVMADPRTGVSVPLTMGGQPLGAKPKDIPAAANTAILANSQNLVKVQQAIDLLEGKQVGVMSGDKSATGVKAYLPNGLLNRWDPKGVDTRAAIADIGSLLVHDRSGAAVTAAETPRLMPFIPLATDDAATAAKKLKRFKQIYESEATGLAEAYGAGAGYRPRGGGAAPPASGGLTPAEQTELEALRKQLGRR